MSLQNVYIKRAVLDLTLPGELHEKGYEDILGKTLLEEISAFIGEEIEKQVPGKKRVSIPSLEIDLGPIKSYGSEKEFAERFRALFPEALRRSLQAETAKENELALIISFLETGHYPWWASQDKNKDLDLLVSELPAVSYRKLLEWLRGAATSPQVRKRFTSQLKPAAAERIMIDLLGEERKTMPAILLSVTDALRESGIEWKTRTPEAVVQWLLQFIAEKKTVSFSREELLSQFVATIAGDTMVPVAALTVALKTAITDLSVSLPVAKEKNDPATDLATAEKLSAENNPALRKKLPLFLLTHFAAYGSVPPSYFSGNADAFIRLLSEYAEKERPLFLLHLQPAFQQPEQLLRMYRLLGEKHGRSLFSLFFPEQQETALNNAKKLFAQLVQTGVLSKNHETSESLLLATATLQEAILRRNTSDDRLPVLLRPWIETVKLDAERLQAQVQFPLLPASVKSFLIEKARQNKPSSKTDAEETKNEKEEGDDLNKNENRREVVKKEQQEEIRSLLSAQYLTDLLGYYLQELQLPWWAGALRRQVALLDPAARLPVSDEEFFAAALNYLSLHYPRAAKELARKATQEAALSNNLLWQISNGNLVSILSLALPTQQYHRFRFAAAILQLLKEKAGYAIFIPVAVRDIAAQFLTKEETADNTFPALLVRRLAEKFAATTEAITLLISENSSFIRQVSSLSAQEASTLLAELSASFSEDEKVPATEKQLPLSLRLTNEETIAAFRKILEGKITSLRPVNPKELEEALFEAIENDPSFAKALTEALITGQPAAQWIETVFPESFAEGFIPGIVPAAFIVMAEKAAAIFAAQDLSAQTFTERKELLFLIARNYFSRLREKQIYRFLPSLLESFAAASGDSASSVRTAFTAAIAGKAFRHPGKTGINSPADHFAWEESGSDGTTAEKNQTTKSSGTRPVLFAETVLRFEAETPEMQAMLLNEKNRAEKKSRRETISQNAKTNEQTVKTYSEKQESISDFSQPASEETQARLSEELKTSAPEENETVTKDEPAKLTSEEEQITRTEDSAELVSEEKENTTSTDSGTTVTDEKNAAVIDESTSSSSEKPGTDITDQLAQSASEEKDAQQKKEHGKTDAIKKTQLPAPVFFDQLPEAFKISAEATVQSWKEVALKILDGLLSASLLPENQVADFSDFIRRFINEESVRLLEKLKVLPANEFRTATEDALEKLALAAENKITSLLPAPGTKSNRPEEISRETTAIADKEESKAPLTAEERKKQLLLNPAFFISTLLYFIEHRQLPWWSPYKDPGELSRYALHVIPGNRPLALHHLGQLLGPGVLQNELIRQLSEQLQLDSSVWKRQSAAVILFRLAAAQFSSAQAPADVSFLQNAEDIIFLAEAHFDPEGKEKLIRAFLKELIRSAPEPLIRKIISEKVQETEWKNRVLELAEEFSEPVSAIKPTGETGTRVSDETVSETEKSKTFSESANALAENILSSEAFSKTIKELAGLSDETASVLKKKKTAEAAINALNELLPPEENKAVLKLLPQLAASFAGSETSGTIFTRELLRAALTGLALAKGKSLRQFINPILRRPEAENSPVFLQLSDLRKTTAQPAAASIPLLAGELYGLAEHTAPGVLAPEQILRWLRLLEAIVPSPEEMAPLLLALAAHKLAQATGKNEETLLSDFDSLSKTIQAQEETSFVPVLLHAHIEAAKNKIHWFDPESRNAYAGTFTALQQQAKTVRGNEQPFAMLLAERLIKTIADDPGFLRSWEDENREKKKKPQPVQQPENLPFPQQPEDPGEPIYVFNSGLVLFWPFLGGFFRRLGYFEGKAFADPEKQERAVHLLQYLVDESEQSPEHLLPLNKLICGLSPYAALERWIDLTEEEKKEAGLFIQSVKARWESMKNTSLENFRKNFIQREGLLYFKDPNWELQVERKPLDPLLMKLPWGFSTIKFPWVEGIIFVKWKI